MMGWVFVYLVPFVTCTGFEVLYEYIPLAAAMNGAKNRN